MLRRGGEGADGLDRIETEKDVALPCKFADCLNVEAIAAQEMAGGESEQAGARGDRLTDEFGGDLANFAGLQVDHFHALFFQLFPGIDVGRIIVEVGHDLIPGLPGKAVCDEAEAEARGAEQGDFRGITFDERGGGIADPVHASDEHIGVIEFAGGGRIVKGVHRCDRDLRHRGDGGMGHKNAVAAGGKGLAAPRFVRVDLLEESGHDSLDAAGALTFLD